MASGLPAFFGILLHGLHGDLALVLHDLGGAVGLRNRDGSHGRSLHGDGVGHLGGNLLVEAQDGAQLLVEVDVTCAVGSLDAGVVGQLDLLAGLTRLLGDHLLDGAALGVLRSQQDIAVGGVGRNGDLEHGVGRSGVLGVLRHEVGLAGQAEDVGLAALDLRHDDTLGGGAVGTLGDDELTLLADDVLCAGEIALGLHERLLAVHHAGSGHLAELHYVGCFDFHIFKEFFCSTT